MLPRWLMVLLMMFAEDCSARREARIRFLQAQVELLRQKVPGNRVILTPEERARLLKLGAAMGHNIDDLIGIVDVKTYKRWLREKAADQAPGRVGRRRVVPPSLRALILRLSRENTGWGVRRIVGELKKLALPSSRSTVRRVLVDEGVLPDPDRRAPKGVTTPWRTFVDMHLNTMVACDFFCKNVWTPFGKRVAYGLMFIHLGSRKVFVSPGTYHPTGEWVQQQARNVTMWLEDENLELRFLIHDRDMKFTEAFDEHFRSVGEQVVKTPFQAPVANCFAESWIGTLKRECLNHFFCFSLRHLDHIVQAYTNYYNELRPHQGKDNRPLTMSHDPIRATESPPPTGEVGPVKRHALLGGLLSHYERKAA
ncbi:MAG: integrase core domain-containing protein [Phycisphaerales bacterium]